MVPRWEYFVLSASRYHTDETDKKMLDLGQAGWELVAVTLDDLYRDFHFKRQIEPRITGAMA